jgi:hypothetical protein
MITERGNMGVLNKTEKSFHFRFIDGPSTVLLELTNLTDRTLKSIEVLTIFLQEEKTSVRGPSHAHIRFDAVAFMKPREKAVLSHRTWINGKPVDIEHDQLERLKVMPGMLSPYVLNISWEDAEGKIRFQRIPVGH